MQRTVQFYRLTDSMGNDLPYEFPATDLVRRLQEMEEQDLDRKIECRDGMELLAQGVEVRTFPALAMYRTRRANLPHLEEDGVISDLPLGDTQTLAEVTYFGFFDRNVVAVIYNHEGPRAKRLGFYISGMFDINVGMSPILRDDLAELLEQMRLTAIEISIPSAQIPTLVAPGEDWARSLDSAAQLMQDGLIRMAVSVGQSGSREQKRIRGRRIRELATQLFASREDLVEFRSATVRGVNLETNREQGVNLLEQMFVSQIEIPDEEMTTIGEATQSAMRYLGDEWIKNREYLTRNTPEVAADGVAPDLVGPLRHNGTHDR